MDRGELLKIEFVVTPGQNGSFVVRGTAHGPHEQWGFTSFTDLIAFLQSEAEVLLRNDGEEKQLGGIVGGADG
jgi:hypothetical protein